LDDPEDFSNFLKKDRKLSYLETALKRLKEKSKSSYKTYKEFDKLQTKYVEKIIHLSQE